MPRESRLILHVDVDAFFASVEQLLTPALRGRPVIVGSGCIASCSYEARRFGLHAGMSLRRALELCPDAVRLPGRYATYRCFAEHIWHICRRYVPALETFLDEAYGEATGSAGGYGGPEGLGRHLQQAVADEVRLPVSVGLGANRLLAKVASARGKPGGVVWVPPERAEDFLAPLPVDKLPGAGPKTVETLADLNVRTVGELRKLPRATLRTIFGRRGELLHDRSRGLDPRPLRPDAPPKSISRETTFHQPTQSPGEIAGMLHYLLERALRAARKHALLAGRIELTIRYDDWKDRAAARTLPEPTDADDDVLEAVLDLLARLHTRRVAMRHVGVVLSRLCPRQMQRRLFEPPARRRGRDVTRAVDAIRDRWGHAAVVTGRSVELLGNLQQDDYGFVLRTPSLTK